MNENNTTPITPVVANNQLEEELDLAQLLGVLLDAKWLIVGIASVVFLIAIGYAFTAAPTYQADALLQIQGDSALSNLTSLQDLSSLIEGGGSSKTDTEIQIITSRSVVGAAIDALNLDIVIEPVFFPVIGGAIARHNEKSGNGLASPLLGLSDYAWGGEQLKIDRLNLSDSLNDQPLELVAGPSRSFTLYGSDGSKLLSGVVGSPAQSADGSIQIYVSQLVANAGARFIVIKQRSFEVYRYLSKILDVSEQGKDSGILEIKLQGQDRTSIAKTVAAICNFYLRQNVESRSAQAQQTLEFLNTQLPQLRKNLDAAQAQYDAYQSHIGSIDLSLETQAILQKMAAIETQIEQLELQRTQQNAQFTASHPVMQTLANQIAELKSSKAGLEGEIRNMPQQVQQAVQLKQNVEVANELYTTLLNKAQSMNVLKAGTVGNVRIVDPAVIPAADDYIKPKKGLVAAFGLVAGLFLGVVAAFILRALNQGVVDADVLEQRLGLPMYASIPHSEFEERQSRRRKRGEGALQLLAAIAKDDMTVESLRSLRTSLQFAMLDSSNNRIAISGPSPAIGKSFVSANLSYLLAESGKRVLLIDADMRRGHLHRYFGLKRGAGLSGLITQEVAMGNAIHHTEHPNFDFVPAGVIPPNPSELLMSSRFSELLSTFSKNYDVVILDTPPILAVTDAVIISRLVSTIFLVLKSGFHPMREIEHTVKRLRQNGLKPHGLIFNDIPVYQARYGRYGRYGKYGKYGKYQYHYQYSYTPTSEGEGGEVAGESP